MKNDIPEKTLPIYLTKSDESKQFPNSADTNCDDSDSFIFSEEDTIN